MFFLEILRDPFFYIPVLVLYLGIGFLLAETRYVKPPDEMTKHVDPRPIWLVVTLTAVLLWPVLVIITLKRVIQRGS